MGALIRRLWCRRFHAWRGWDMTEEEQRRYKSPNMHIGSWSRSTCRFCKGHDEMPKRPSFDGRRRLLFDQGLRQDREWGMNARLGSISRTMTPGYGWCYACGTTWAFVQSHSTTYKQGHGCFPLCEKCWAERTPQERLPFYEILLARWEEDRPVPDDERDAIRAAVLAGG